jgi:hypothetical protein
MLDYRGNPISVRGTFDILVERRGLERLVKTLSEPNADIVDVAAADQHSAGTRNAGEPAKPSRAQKPLSTRRIAEIGAAYVGGHPDRPSMEDFVRFAREDHGVTGHLEELRAEYRRRYPNHRVGRRRKSPSENR